MYYLYRCVEADESVLSSVSQSVLVRMSSTLVEVVTTVIDVSDYVTEMKMATVVPWILLFYLIRLSVFTVCGFLQLKPDYANEHDRDDLS